MPDLPPLPDAIRASLPLEAQTYVTALEAEVTALRSQVEGLSTRVADLAARVGQTSQTSSRPPSSDPPSAPPRPKKQSSSQRKRGGQPGHRGHHRPLKAVSEVDAVVEHRPTLCPACQAPVPADTPTVGQPQRQQVWEVPPIQPTVTEHQYYAVCCPSCQGVVEAPRPTDVPPGAFGPRLASLIGLLVGRYRLSQREVRDFVASVFEVPISTASVASLCEHVSDALEAPYSEAQTLVEQAPHANVDETTWQQAGQRRWLWVAVTTLVTLFRLATSRRRVELTALLGERYDGRVTSDRFSVYAGLNVAQRQVCWAHLKRDLLALSQGPWDSKAWATRALAVEGQVFALWHRFKDGAIDRVSLLVQMQPLQEQFAQVLRDGLTRPWYKVSGFCGDLLKVERALWTFVSVPGIEPTNNAAERALRPAVLWRKGSFGCDSEGGLRFVERVMTVSASCRQRSRPLLPFLTQAVAAHWARQSPPSFFPAP